MLGAIFWSQRTLGAIFAQIFRDFAQILRDFAHIFNKSKLLVVRLHPLHPRLLHQWSTFAEKYDWPNM